MAGFFPIFFRDYWGVGRESATITLALGVANSVASILIVLTAPLLGAMADHRGAYKRFLLVFAILGQGMTAGLFLIHQGGWYLAAIIYVLASLGFMAANIFYDALIVWVAPRERFDAVSALGFALGYLGGGILFALCVLMSLFPSSFGLADATMAVRTSFLLVALWWLVFSLPLLLKVQGPTGKRAMPIIDSISLGFRQVKETLLQIRRLRMVALFLLAYWLYIDGVDTIVRMAVDYGRALGFNRNDLIIALLITQFIGFPAALFFGHLGQWLGTKPAIYIAIGIYILITLWGSRMTQTWEFYGLAVAIGLVQGGIQSLSRAFYARLVPVDKVAEFFGFYNMLGKFAAVIGPVLVGGVGVLSGSPRVGMLSIVILFVAGGFILLFVDTSSSADQGMK
ncbi:MAG: MFS transporter [Gammaproteobacteria bacterium]|nr:MFS transporter [Gammaproteobacteria bacterium]